PRTLTAMDRLADHLARQGRWAAASTLLEEALRAKPERITTGPPWSPWLPLAVIRLRTGDEAGYRDLRTRMLRQVRRTVGISPGLKMVQVCTLLPSEPDEASRLLALARRVAPVSADGRGRLMPIGVAEYRAGDLRAAREALARHVMKGDSQAMACGLFLV